MHMWRDDCAQNRYVYVPRFLLNPGWGLGLWQIERTHHLYVGVLFGKILRNNLIPRFIFVLPYI